ncbi:STAS domain-containing protein [Limibacter armeniacum]|uniref:STAS domain-containing protein n=1 Tax=Limibacter armeniacum TaxID=466084 RepID=UPI002FE4FE74
MSLTYSLYDKTLLLKIEGDLLGFAEEKELYKVAERHLSQTTNCIVDTSQMGHINSKGLSILVRILTLLDKSSGTMVLISPPSQFNKLLKITKLDKVFLTAESRSEALRVLPST